MDNDGKIGRAYGARTTPHMYVIDPQGKLVYAGAIDSKPTANPADIKTATNYVNQALGEVAGRQAGQPADDAGLRLLDQVRGRGLRPVAAARGCSRRCG